MSNSPSPASRHRSPDRRVTAVWLTCTALVAAGVVLQAVFLLFDLPAVVSLAAAWTVRHRWVSRRASRWTLDDDIRRQLDEEFGPH